MRIRFAVPLFAALVFQAAQPTRPPDTEIYLSTLTRVDGRLVVGPPLDISNSPGYDNQPSFTPDGTGVLFTSVRGGRKPDPANAAASGSDIYRYDIASGRVQQVTETPESEYSPTVTPDGQHVSTVRVEADGTQRLWRFGLDGRDPTLILRDVKPVGYHAWVDEHTVALYILGQSGRQSAAQPSTLQLADVPEGRTRIVARNIGRSVQRMPDGRISFVLREGRGGSGEPERLSIQALDPRTDQASRLVDAPVGATEVDTTWTPDGLLLLSQRTALLGWRAGDAGFSQVADLAALGLSNVTRLAVARQGDRLAMVAPPR